MGSGSDGDMGKNLKKNIKTWGYEKTDQTTSREHRHRSIGFTDRLQPLPLARISSITTLRASTSRVTSSTPTPSPPSSRHSLLNNSLERIPTLTPPPHSTSFLLFIPPQPPLTSSSFFQFLLFSHRIHSLMSVCRTPRSRARWSTHR